jgi:hypothetical protein
MLAALYFPNIMLISSAQTKADTPKQKEALNMLTAALEAINTLPEAFTRGRYNMLRVIAAFPLAANLESSSKKVHAALSEDDHTLALLSRSALVAALATDTRTLSITQMLVDTLKRKRGEAGSDGDTEMVHVSKKQQIDHPKGR